MVLEKRGQAAADAQVEAGMAVLGVDPVHVIAVLGGHHFQGQLVVVAQEQGPLAGLRDRRRLLEDIEDGEAVLHANGHEQPRHERKVKRHVALVAGAEVGDRVLRPLVGLGQQHAVAEALVDVAAQLLQELVRLRQVLAVGPLALVEVGHRVQPEGVDAEAEPEVERPEHGLLDRRVGEVEVRLVRVEAVPVVGLGDRVPGPVGVLEIAEDDPRLLELIRRVAPDVEVAPRGARRRAPRAAEPRVLVRGVVDDQLGNDAQAAAVGLAQQEFAIGQAAVDRVDVGVVGDVVAVVLQRRRVEREQP